MAIDFQIRRDFLVTFLLNLLCIVFFAGCSTSGQFDFGDLEDPDFPTLSNSTSSRVPGRVGPYHQDVGQEWIGFSAESTTTVEPEAKLVQQDADDGLVRISRVTVNGDGARIAFVTVPVSILPAADNSLRYLNVAADFDHSGTFQRYAVGDRFQEEWVVVNLPISLAPGSRELMSSPYVVVDPASVSGQVCTRATLSTEPIDPQIFADVGGWDGSGPAEGFARGETEDHCPTVQPLEWQPVGTGVFIPPSTPIPVEKLPIPKQPPIQIPPNQPPPFLEPDIQRKKIPPQEPSGSDPQDDKTPGQDNLGPPDGGTFTEVLKRNHYIPRDQGVEVNHLKQGPNECVPTSAANSVQYLLDKRRLENPSAPLLPLESMGVEALRDFLKMQMGTDPMEGTKINPASPSAPGFLSGKYAFSQLFQSESGSTGGGLQTDFTDDASWDNICDCITEGADVEVVIYAYDPETGLPDHLGHMVHVIGCNRLANGELQLVINDPATEDDDSNNGLGTITAPVSNGAPLQSGDAFGKGGLELTHYPVQLDPPRVLRIEQLFCEKLLP